MHSASMGAKQLKVLATPMKNWVSDTDSVLLMWSKSRNTTNAMERQQWSPQDLPVSVFMCIFSWSSHFRPCHIRNAYLFLSLMLWVLLNHKVLGSSLLSVDSEWHFIFDSISVVHTKISFIQSGNILAI